MDTQQLQLPHKLTLNDRKHLSVTGVTEVVSFHEQEAVLRLGPDTLCIRGEDLHMKSLSLDSGLAAVEGRVDELIYGQAKEPGGFWHRLLG